MNFQIHHNPGSLPTNNRVAYYRQAYLSSQNYPNLLVFENEHFFLPVNFTDHFAISIPRSPFGSFALKTTPSKEAFLQFNDRALGELASHHIKELEIVHPSTIYDSFVESSLMKESGYRLSYVDLNQHIPLNHNWEEHIHKMQLRKLATLREEGFEFRVMSKSDLKMAHQFLAVCRQAQGLDINISLELLKELNDKMPEAYECFGVFRDNKISALCITVRVTDEIAYYYLPATSPMFRSQSPMVLLIAGMVDYYRNQGFKYLDLGVSSVHGKPQETLRLFKERMGAVETEKPTFKRSL